ncbi:DUF445 domain-containing protein [Frateuria aurantia]
MTVVFSRSPRPAESLQARGLRRTRRIAGGLLLLAGLTLLLAMIAQAWHPAWPWQALAAVSEAALVGGLADWFAVVALFRHPLGLRWIPHTAIIPRKKDALGRSLARFICQHFMSDAQIVAQLQRYDPATRLGSALTDPQQAEVWGRLLQGLSPHVIRLLDQPGLRQLMLHTARHRLGRLELAPLLGRGLSLLTRDGRHRELVNSVLRDAANLLQQPATQALLADKVANEIWAVFRWLNVEERIARSMAERLTEATRQLLLDMMEDPRHPFRRRLDGHLRHLIMRLRDDASLAQRINQMRDQLLDNPELAGYLQALWDDGLRRLQQDLAAGTDSRIAAHLQQATHALGRQLLDDPSLGQAFNQWCQQTLPALLGPYRSTIEDFIVQRVERWSADELSHELELAVGRDLQYIRYNGTLVGGLIGGLLYALARLLHLAFH